MGHVGGERPTRLDKQVARKARHSPDGVLILGILVPNCGIAVQQLAQLTLGHEKGLRRHGRLLLLLLILILR